MRESRTYGSAGALGGQPPRATQPFSCSGFGQREFREFHGRHGGRPLHNFEECSSEPSLSKDWLKPEEDAAWQDL